MNTVFFVYQYDHYIIIIIAIIIHHGHGHRTIISVDSDYYIYSAIPEVAERRVDEDRVNLAG